MSKVAVAAPATIRRPPIICEASIDLGPSESLTDFQNALAAALCPVIDEYGLVEIDDEDKRQGDFYVTDVRPGAVIVRVYNYGGGPSGYVQIPWVRGRDLAFTFGVPVEVSQVTSYAPTPAANRVFDMEPEAPSVPGTVPPAPGAPVPVGDAVEKPTAAQRKNLPAVAFAAPFFADKDGNYKAGGEFIAGKSKLPFQTADATDAASDTYVDLPKLRNALARFDATDFATFGDSAAAVKKKAKAILQRAADALLKSATTDAAVKVEMRTVLAEGCRATIGEIRKALARSYVNKDREGRMTAEQLAESAIREQGPFDGPVIARLVLDLSDLRRGNATQMLTRQAGDGL